MNRSSRPPRARPGALVPWAMGAVIAGVAVHLLSPGWLFFDSRRLWGFAGVLRADPGLDLGLRGLNAGWPLLNILVRVPFAGVEAGPAVFAFLQATWVLAGTATLALHIGSPLPAVWRHAIALLACLQPVVWNYGLFHSSDVLALGFALWAAGVLVKTRVGPSDGWLVALGCAGLASARYNAVPPALVLAAIAALRLRRRLLAPAVVCAAASGLLYLWSRTAGPYDSSREGSFLRLLAMREWTRDEAVEQALEGVSVPPRIRAARGLPDDCLDVGIWCEPGLRGAADPGRTQPSWRSLYLSAALRHPWAALRANVRFMSRSSGWSSPLPETEVGKFRPDDPVPLRMPQDGPRRLALNLLTWQREALGGAFARPVWMVPLAFVALVANRRRRQALAWLAAAASWYVPWSLFTPARDFRYMVPVLVPASVIVLVGLAERAYRLTPARRRRRAVAASAS